MLILIAHRINVLEQSVVTPIEKQPTSQTLIQLYSLLSSIHPSAFSYHLPVPLQLNSVQKIQSDDIPSATLASTSSWASSSAWESVNLCVSMYVIIVSACKVYILASLTSRLAPVQVKNGALIRAVGGNAELEHIQTWRTEFLGEKK